MRAWTVRGGQALLIGATAIVFSGFGTGAFASASAVNASESASKSDFSRARIDFGQRYDPSSVGAIASTTHGYFVAGSLDRLGYSWFGAFYVARIDRGGNIDHSFGSRGWRRYEAAHGRSNVPTAISVDSRGRVLVAGTVVPDRPLPGSDDDEPRPWKQGFVMRLRSSGALDRSFGKAGVRSFRFSEGIQTEINALSIEPNGSIVVLGSSGGRVGIGRLSANGDFTGGNTFKSELMPPPSQSCDHGFARANALLPWGSTRWLLGGTTDSPGVGGCQEEVASLLAGVDSNGSLDSGFGQNGATLVPVTGGRSWEDTTWTSLAKSRPSEVVAAGRAVSGKKHEMAVARFTSSGSLDPTFSSDGVARLLGTSQSREFSQAIGVAVDARRRVTVSGVARESFSDRLVVLRLLADGRLDRTFGKSGVARVENDVDNGSGSLVRARNGDVLVAGVAFKPGSRRGHYLSVALFGK